MADEIDDLFKQHLAPSSAAAATGKKKPSPDAERIGWLNSVLDPARAFARGAVNKATFGGAEHAAAWLRGKPVEDIRGETAELRRDNPISSTVGDVSGLIAQQLPVFKGLKVASAAGKAASPALAAVHRGLTGGSIPAGIGGQALVGGTTAGLNAAADAAWGDRPVSAGDAIKEIAGGTVAGGIGGGIGNALFGGAIARAGPQIPKGILSQAELNADPVKMAAYGLTGAAKPNAEQLLRMTPGASRDTYAPIVGEIFERAGKGASDRSFPALRTNEAAQFPSKVAPNYVGSFAQRAKAAADNAATANKAVAAGVPTTPIRAASFLPEDVREVSKMLRDAAVNKRSPNSPVPHAFEERFVKGAVERATDPAAVAKGSNLLGKVDPSVARQLERTVQDAEFKHMADVLRSGPRPAPPAAAGRGVRDINLNIPLVSEIWNTGKGAVQGAAAKRSVSQGTEAGTALVDDPVQGLMELGVRTPGQAASGIVGTAATNALLENLIRKLGIMPEGVPR
jgi:hypothetical protein